MSRKDSVGDCEQGLEEEQQEQENPPHDDDEDRTDAPPAEQ